MHMGHQTGVGVGVVLLLVLVGGVIWVGYRFHAHSAKPFRFHYFKVTSCLVTSCSHSGSRWSHMTSWRQTGSSFRRL